MGCIHELANWPKLTWDDAKLSALLAEVRHRQGRLLGRMEGLGFRLRSEAQLSTLTSDVVKSSAIEGEKLDAEEVRSSIARRLELEYAGAAVPSRDVEGIVEMMLDATQRHTQPLTTERLFGLARRPLSHWAQWYASNHRRSMATGRDWSDAGGLWSDGPREGAF